MKKKVGVLLVNLGTPDDPSVSKVRKYLFQFLNDPRVIDLPWLGRFLLVNFIIVPFRAFSSSKIYQKLWTDKGSPLLLYGQELRDALQQKLDGNSFEVFLAMRYQKPSLESILEQMRLKNFDQIIILPLYPQYASSSTGSTIERALKIIQKWYVIPELNVISQFYDEPGFINSFVERGKEHDIESYDHVIFSYHGLPVRQVDKVYDDGLPCSDHSCEKEINESNKFCYKATCYATTRLLADKLNIPESKYTVGFQSRLDKNWLEPFSDKVVEQLAKEGKKRVLVFSPAFTADCLETNIEIGDEYLEIFHEHGGEHLQLVSSLNAQPIWVDTLKQMVEKRAIL
tara:strand:+ start:3178 stop:4203 length:1026 start_codon:yes stop_codon:yes gene_type:complete